MKTIINCKRCDKPIIRSTAEMMVHELDPSICKECWDEVLNPPQKKETDFVPPRIRRQIEEEKRTLN